MTSLCASLFAAAGNTITVTTKNLKTGHEPVHQSSSQTCVNIDADKDQWFCHSCQIGGGPVQAFMSLQGCAYAEAEAAVQAMGGAAASHKKRREERPQASQAAATLAPCLQDLLQYDLRQQRWRGYGVRHPGVWTLIPEELAQSQLWVQLDQELPGGFAWRYLRDIEQFLKTRLLSREVPPASVWIPFHNGLLNPSTMQWKLHSPDNQLTWTLPYAYEEGATCPRTLGVLHDMVGGDHGQVQLLRAFAKAAVLGRTDFHKYLELLGPGGTGKSTYIHMLQAMLGLHNAGTTSLRRLEANRFELVDLVTKKLVVITDSERYTGPVPIFKAWVGQDTLPLERKYAKEQRQGVGEGLLVVAANEAIQSADYTSGLERRRLTVYFGNRPLQEKRLLEPVGETFVGDLAKELAGLVNWILALADRDMEQLLHQPRQMVASLQPLWASTLLAVNPLADWANSALLYDPSLTKGTAIGIAVRIKDTKDSDAYYEQHDRLYPNYCAYAEATKSNPVGVQRFSHLLEDFLAHQLRLWGVQRKREATGMVLTRVRLRTDADKDTPPLMPQDTPLMPQDTPEDVGDNVGCVDSQNETTSHKPTPLFTDVDCVDCVAFLKTYMGEGGEDGAGKEGKGEKSAPPIEVDEPPTPAAQPTFPSNGAVNHDVGRFSEATQPTPSSACVDEAASSLAEEGWALPEGVSIKVGASADLPAVEYVTTTARLEALLPMLLTAPQIGLDIETTGLDPHQHRIRLVQLATPEQTLVIDASHCALPALAPLFRQPATVFLGHNLKFDTKFLAAVGLPWPAQLRDTMLEAQLLGAGTDDGQLNHSGLAAVVQRYLGLTVAKEEQKSDWSGALSPTQLAYAARDAALLLPLAAALATATRAAGLARVCAIEAACVPALAWMESTGVPVDAQHWAEQGHFEANRAAALEAELYAMLRQSANGHATLLPEAVNWGSPQQVVAVLQRLGHQVAGTGSAVLASLAATEPLAALLLEYREAKKRAGTYGTAWLHQHCHSLTGRIHADYLQLGSVAGRMSCTRPNMQNLPRSAAYRTRIRPDEGWCLVKADYSQVELRIAALMAQEPAMLAAFAAGEDLHRLTASRVLGVASDAVTSEHRQLAKSLNFGLLYGMGAEGLQQYAFNTFHVALTPAEAARHRQAFFALYPALRQWHQATGAALSQSRNALDTRTLADRRRLGVARYTEAINTPVQGSGADGLKLAMGRLFAHRHEVPDARLILAVHDELVAECPAEDAEATAAWLRRHMVAAMEEIVGDGVPIVVDTTIGQDWAGTPLATTLA